MRRAVLHVFCGEAPANFLGRRGTPIFFNVRFGRNEGSRPTARPLWKSPLSLPVSKIGETDNNDSIFDPHNQVFYRRGRWRRLIERWLKDIALVSPWQALVQSNRERFASCTKGTKCPYTGRRQAVRSDYVAINARHSEKCDLPLPSVDAGIQRRGLDFDHLVWPSGHGVRLGDAGHEVVPRSGGSDHLSPAASRTSISRLALAER